MKSSSLVELLRRLAGGALSADQVYERLQGDLDGTKGGMACLDQEREARVGAPEIIYGESKSAGQIAVLLRGLDKGGAGALATRVSREKADLVRASVQGAQYNPSARTLVLPSTTVRSAGRGRVGVVCAGTSDLPVADEAAECLRFLGHEVDQLCDVGVAGLHRLLGILPQLEKCSVLIVVAGMEGALPTVIAGLMPQPIVALPTSVGYGVSEGGFAALLGMLSSCAPGLVVVNIDNGIGAALAAARINRRDS